MTSQQCYFLLLYLTVFARLGLFVVHAFHAVDATKLLPAISSSIDLRLAKHQLMESLSFYFDGRVTHRVRV